MVVRSDTELSETFSESKQWKADSSAIYNFIEEVEINGTKTRVVSSQSGHERNHLFSNVAGKGFVDRSLLSGLDSIADSRSNAIWDFDHDGQLDVALINANNPYLQLFRNRIESDDRNFVVVRLVGGNSTGNSSQQWSNRDGIGAVVTVAAGENKYVRESRAGEGFASQNSKSVLVGIDNASNATVSIKWPSGRTTEHGTIDAGRHITCYENPADSSDGSGQVLAEYTSSNYTAQRPSLATGDVFGKSRLADQGDKVSLGVFVSLATWCPQCKANQPQVKRLAQQFGDSIQLLAMPVDSKDTAEKLKTYREEYQPVYEILIDRTPDEVSKMKEIVTRVSQQGALPSTVVTDSKGQVIKVMAGVPTVSEIAKLLEAIN